MKIIIAIALIFSTAFSFGQSSQNMGTNLENDFSKSKLGAENVAAFETRAKQKVEDFCNYIQLISNKNFDTKFRQHSQKSALSLFNSDQCVINDSIVTGVDSLVTISNFLDAVYATHFQQIEGQASQIVLQDDLTLTESGDYAGTITYVQTLTCYDEAGTIIETVIENKTVGVTLNRKTKSFGTTEKIIWVVALCDIASS
ncbi:MAG: hypothetical protein GQ574_22025 [Crocinitomix sp.]|nr:hypothetical protein [Crocinitomix sp.]